MHILVETIYWILLVSSVILIPFNLPGNFIILGLNFLYMLLFSDTINWELFGILAVLAGVSELMEFLVTVKSTEKFGGSKRSMFASIIGSIIGAVIGSGFLILIGTLLGAMVGAFIGSFVVDYMENNDMNQAMRTGMGAFVGVAGGKLSKIIIAIVMLILIALK